MGRWQEPRSSYGAMAANTKPPKTYPEGRTCEECGGPMSIYNGDRICNACDLKRVQAFAQRPTKVKEYLGTDPRGHREGPRPKRKVSPDVE